MTIAHSEILRRKVKSGGVDLAQFPKLKTLCAASAESFVAALRVVTQSQTSLLSQEATIVDAAMMNRILHNSGIVFTLGTPSQPSLMVVSVLPSLIVSINDCLLGSDFDFTQDTHKDVTPDWALAQCFMEEAAPSACSACLPGNSFGALADIIVGSMQQDEFLADLSAWEIWCPVTLDVDIGGTEIKNAFKIMFHTRFLEQGGFMSQSEAEAPASSVSTKWSKVVTSHVESIPLNLDVVLTRAHLKISQLSKLEIGQHIALPNAETGDVDLVMETQSGPLAIGRGRLGTLRGNKAVKLQLTGPASAHAVDA